MQTRDKRVYDVKSIDELMRMQENFGDDKIPISKIISDIDYVVHEMGHAFEHLINAKNPSYLYDFVMRNFKYSEEEQSAQSSIYDGEQFPISMEKIILEHLRQERTTREVWIRQICNDSRCTENLCCKKRK